MGPLNWEGWGWRLSKKLSWNQGIKRCLSRLKGLPVFHLSAPFLGLLNLFSPAGFLWAISGGRMHGPTSARPAASANQPRGQSRAAPTPHIIFALVAGPHPVPWLALLRACVFISPPQSPGLCLIQISITVFTLIRMILTSLYPPPFSECLWNKNGVSLFCIPSAQWIVYLFSVATINQNNKGDFPKVKSLRISLHCNRNTNDVMSYEHSQRVWGFQIKVRIA
jgi:hypothetical protein